MAVVTGVRSWFALRIAVGCALVVLLSASSAWAQTATSAPENIGGDPAPLSSQAADLPSIVSLVRDLGGDMRRLPSMRNAIILGGGALASVASRRGDPSLTARAVASDGLDTFLEPGAVLGGGLVQVGGAAALFGVGRVLHRPAMAVAGADLVRAQLLNTAMTHALKFAVHRTRPNGSRYSFPSGHTSSSFATATVLQRHFGWRVGVPAYALATYVGASRLQENQHFLTDVLFGAAVGVVAGRTVTIGHHRGVIVSPFATRGGGGLGVTWIGAQ